MNHQTFAVMIREATKIALITNNPLIADEIKTALQGLFDVDIYESGFELHHVMEKSVAYKAIISDDELAGANGIAFHNVLRAFGYGKIPFLILLNKIDNDQRRSAMCEHIAEIFSKPIDLHAIRLRVPYLVENYSVAAVNLIEAPHYKSPVLKRIFDITFSGLGLILLSPLILLITILIKAESKGPAFYYSLRVGSGYKVFKFFKFRSMYTGADARLKELRHMNQYNKRRGGPPDTNLTIRDLCEFCDQAGIPCSNPLYADNRVVCEILHSRLKRRNSDMAFIKIKNDPRVTRIGNFIRRTSLDELPQLWNVFIGDMSVVGNRPLPLYEAEKLTSDKYTLRFMAPAGITGLWQVEKRGRREMSEAERLDLDNNYAKTHSFINDILLILRTIPALFQSENI